MRFLLLALIALVTGHENHATVELSYATYNGYYNTSTGIVYFRGIPYAQPPVNELRWRKPLPIENDVSLRGKTMPATKLGPACYQSAPAYLSGATDLEQSEDCLILDVLAPARSVSSALPVLVQIHGGGYIAGSTQSLPGDALVQKAKGQILYVAIQYRLGMFGFLAGSEIEGDGVANAGLYDQRLALDWIQRNIARFGGDPSRVTIWGGSAGGGSVTYQLIAGGAFGSPPFHAAIAEYPFWQPLRNASSRQQQFEDILGITNCTAVACLRSLPSAELARAQTVAMNTTYPSPGYGFGIFNYGPVVDGKFIRQLPDVEFKQGNFHSVPTIVDRDAYEGVAFTNTSLRTQVEETMDAKYIFPNAGPSFYSRLYQVYGAAKFNSTFFQRQAWFGDFTINCPTYFMASAMSDRNQNSSAVFKLVFSAGTQLHGATGAFLNPTPSPGFNQTISDILSDYWVSFTVTGDPNTLRSRKAPFWPSYKSGGEGSAEGESVGFSVLSITYTTTVTEEDPDAGAQCDFFGSHGYQVLN